MKAKLRFENGLRFVGTNEQGMETAFDTTQAGGGTNSAASPVEVLLQAAAACSSMDVVAILKKQRRTIDHYAVNVEGIRREQHPRIFTGVLFHFELTSPNATMNELRRAIELSLEKYCSVSITMKLAGADLQWTATLINSQDGTRQAVSSEVVQSAAIVH